MRVLVDFVVLDDTFQQSAFNLTSVVGGINQFGTFSMVNNSVLLMTIGFVFDWEFGAEFVGVIDELHFVVWIAHWISASFLNFVLKLSLTQ